MKNNGFCKVSKSQNEEQKPKRLSFLLSLVFVVERHFTLWIHLKIGDIGYLVLKKDLTFWIIIKNKSDILKMIEHKSRIVLGKL